MFFLFSLVSITSAAETFTFFDDNQKLSFYPETTFSNDALSSKNLPLDLEFEFFVNSLDGELIRYF